MRSDSIQSPTLHDGDERLVDALRGDAEARRRDEQRREDDRRRDEERREDDRRRERRDDTASSSRRLGRRPWRAQRAVAARRTAVAAGRTARAARMVAAEQGWGVAVVVGPSLVAECARAGARTRTRAGAGSRCAW